MAHGPAQEFRQWLEGQPRRAGEVPLDNLLRAWGIGNPTPQDRAWIQQALAQEGIGTQPSLDGLDRHQSTTLWLSSPAPAAGHAQAPAQPAPTGSRAATTAGVGLVALGALIGVISLFLEWSFGATLWQIFTLLDVATVLLALAAIALGIGVLLAPRVPYLRAALVPIAMFFALPALVTAIEFVVGPGDVEVGAIVGILSALAASAGLALLVASDAVAMRGKRPLGATALLIGVGAAAFVALVVTVVQFLPAVEAIPDPAPGGPALGDSLSEWEVAKVTDWVDQLVILALIALAIAAGVARRVPALALGLGVLLAYFALPDVLLALDDAVNGGTFFVADFLSFVSGLVALAGSLLLVTTALRTGG